jgi:exodeoxyribonuclease V alpha subunit
VTAKAAEIDRYDARRAVDPPGALAVYNEAGVLGSADAHVAKALCRLTSVDDALVLLAIALTVRAVRLGSVCLDLREVAMSVTPDVDALAADETGAVGPAIALPPWPDPVDWLAAVGRSPAVAVGVDGPPDRPLRLVNDLLYLDRYWRQEQLVRAELLRRSERPPPVVDEQRLRAALSRLFPGPAPDQQRLAAAAAATGLLTVVAGGPGTGKTRTVARLVAFLRELSDVPPRIALAAPTGKAAARLTESFTAAAAEMRESHLADLPVLQATTVHRLLGWRPGSSSRFAHDRDNRLPFDAVIVDETSMVSLTLMSRLLEAVRPDARLVLVGDPDQLASVEAGAVLGDLAARNPRPAGAGADQRIPLLHAVLANDMAPGAGDAADAEVDTDLRRDVVRLRVQHRFDSVIAEFAEAVRGERADDVIRLLRAGAPFEFVEVDAQVSAGAPVLHAMRRDVVDAGRAVFAAAEAGDPGQALAALDRHRVLCAHRRGPAGVSRWGREVERWLAEAIHGYSPDGEWYVGRPLLVRTNDYDLKLFNGDTGVVVRQATGEVVTAFAAADRPLEFAPSRLSDVETVHAMTVHRAQGSQYAAVTVVLPDVGSPLLTRELFYTAVTRAEGFVRVVATEAAVRAAIATPVQRASGLRH